ncbi:hypothetical protein CFP56_017502 [Quercus suber]|uniref:Uncharacterized protein n=1 Tax=Quercus suber TaxID=58331 RepID=A0AAW0KMX4_QUESU
MRYTIFCALLYHQNSAQPVKIFSFPAQVKAHLSFFFFAVASASLVQQPQKKAKSSNFGNQDHYNGQDADGASVRFRSIVTSGQKSLPPSSSPTRPFVSAVLFNRARTSCTKLQAHSNSKNSVGEDYSCGNSLGFWFVPVSGRRFSTRATNVNDAGSIDSPLMHSMEKKLVIAFGAINRL